MFLDEGKSDQRYLSKRFFLAVIKIKIRPISFNISKKIMSLKQNETNLLVNELFTLIFNCSMFTNKKQIVF
jgi:hypothetical protein